MSESMLHLNGNILCAVDIETTGLDPRHHEIWQICVLPLDSNLDISKKITPFYMPIKLDFPERVDPESGSLKQDTLIKIQAAAIPQATAAGLFEEWVEKMNLGFRKKISPLAQNWPFDASFIKEWLGPSTFEYAFDGRFRDLMACTLFMNDRASFQVVDYPFAKVNLSYVCNCLHVNHEGAHDALADCVATAACYKKIAQGNI